MGAGPPTMRMERAGQVVRESCWAYASTEFHVDGSSGSCDVP